MSKDSYWFKHDSSAHSDIKMLKIKHIYGFEGIGLYWSTIEVLREQSGYRWESDDSSVQCLATCIGADHERYLNFIKDAIGVGLFMVEDGFLFSESLLKRMDVWETKKENGKKGGRPANENRIKTETKTETKTEIKPKLKADQNHKRREDNIKEKKYKRKEKVEYVYSGVDVIEDLYDFLKQNYGIQLDNLLKAGFDVKGEAERFVKDKAEEKFNDNRHLLNAFKSFLKQPKKHYEGTAAENPTVLKGNIYDQIGIQE